MDYKDFWVKIEARVENGYRVSVVQSPAGGGTDTLPLLPPGDATATPTTLQALVRGDTHRDIAQAEVPSAPKDVGRELFDALFAGTVRSLFDKSLGMTQAQAQGLRIKLQIDPENRDLAHLAGLPWEMLYFHATREYLSLSAQTPVVRYLDVQRPYELPPFTEPLRVLVVLANPAGTDGLDLQKERALIEKTWAQLEAVEVDFLDHATRDTLLRALAAKPYHVLHYMGHGGFDDATGLGVLLLEDATGKAAPVTGQALGVLLRDVPSMRLVFLNACETARATESADFDPFAGVASALVMAGMPAVLAMQFPISDQAAIAFADGFYTALAHQQPVDAALGAGRKAIYDARPDSLEWATPVLFMRAPDGYLFKPKRPLFTTKRAWAVVVGVVLVALISAVGLVLGASKPISLDPAALRVAVGRTAELTALSNGEAVVPDAWHSSDTSVARVRGGRVRARRPGTAQITATLGWFSKGHADVTVFAPVAASVRLERAQASMQVGDTLHIPAAVLSDDGYALGDASLSWSVDDAAVARATATGGVVGVSAGRTVVRVTGAGGLTDTLLLSVLATDRPTPTPDDSVQTRSSGNAPPVLVRFALSDQSTFTTAALPWDEGERYYSATARFTAGAPCDDCWYARCDALLQEADVLAAMLAYMDGHRGRASELDDPDARADYARQVRRQLLVDRDMTPLGAQIAYSTRNEWADIESPAERARVSDLVAACTPPQPTDALVFSVTLKNPSDTYLNVTDVRYVVLEDGGEAGGGAGAGLLEPLATYVHPVERRCDWRAEGRSETYPFALTPILEIAPGRSAAFDLQPTFSVKGYTNAFLAPLKIRIDLVTDGGTVRTDAFWIEGPSCAG